MPIILANTTNTLTFSDGTEKTVEDIGNTTSSKDVLALIDDSNVSATSIKPIEVKAIFVSNQSPNSITQYSTFILLGQDTTSENGLYSGGVKQADPIVFSQLYTQTREDGDDYTPYVKAVYRVGTASWSADYNDNYRIGFTTNTSSTDKVDLLDYIPVLVGRLTKVNLTIMGYRADGTSGTFYGEYERAVLYLSGSGYKDISGDLTSRSKVSGSFDRPDIFFEVDEINNTFKLKVTPGMSAATIWFVRGSLEL